MNRSARLNVEIQVSNLYDDLPKNDNGSLQIPIDLSSILDSYGITAFEKDFGRNDISGAFLRDKRKILVNSHDNHKRQLFTIAHELGHFFLHQDMPDEVLYRFPDHSERESEANYFAAKLLMPGHLIKLYWPIIRDSEEMANLFYVSESSMLYRLKNLGLIG